MQRWNMLMKYVSFIVIYPILVLLSSIPNHVYATESSTSGSNTNSSVTATVKPIEIHATNKAEIQTMIQAKKAEMMQKREELRATVEARRTEIKAKIEVMKDQRKKTIAERIQNRLTMINTNRTDHFSRLLTKFSDILLKIATRTAKAKENGKEVAPIETAITSAQTSITNAQTAVNTQSQKTYIIEVTDETKAREEVNAMKEQLRVDLEATKDVVKAAHTSVQNVFEAIRTVVGVSEATPSVSVTPTVISSDNVPG